ncbi:MAG: hypothetical protein SOW08_05775 [Lachnospiraceae bacterium]|nr:hypothetical protein [Lachnospiraceae bacterium]
MKNRFKMRWLLGYSIALIALLIGITYAWFVQNASMTTLLALEKPDTITISDVDGSDMTELDLDYRENTNDRKDPDGTIHILRPLCIKSTSPIHQLEIVHTTNLSSLTFNIYPAAKRDNKYTYSENIKVSGEYVNESSPGSGSATEEVLENYSDKNDVKNTHAYPLYWLAVNCAVQEKWQSGWTKVTSDTKTEFDVATKTEKIFYYTYYYLEISWKEETKETDLFYIMAQNINE